MVNVLHFTTLKIIQDGFSQKVSKVVLLIAVTVFGVIVYQPILSQSYCTPTNFASCGTYGTILRVQFNTLDHSSSCETYTNWPATGTQTTTLTAGNTYTLSVTRRRVDGTSYRHRVWIDYNQNFVLNNAGENVMATDNSAATVSTNVTIPLTATPGSTRMRVRICRTGYNSDPCNGATGSCGLGCTNYGETEDFTITIVAACTAPTTQASSTPTAFSATPDFTGITLNDFTRGDGDNVLIIARATATAAVAPVSGTAYPTADPVFNNGQSSTGAGNYVVFNGNWISGSTSLNVTGLNPGTSYTFDTYEYNNTGTCYKTPAFSNNVTTLSCTPPSQATNAATLNVQNT